MKKLLLLLCFCATFAQAQNADQNNIENTINRYKAALLQRGVDTFWVYQPITLGGKMISAGRRVGDTSCSVAEVKYLYWQEKSEFYRQRFGVYMSAYDWQETAPAEGEFRAKGVKAYTSKEKFCRINVMPAVKIPKSAFSKTLNAAFATIQTDEIRDPEYDFSKNGSYIQVQGGILKGSFEFHLKDSIYKKTFSDAPLNGEKKYYIEGKDTIHNKHYYTNQNTILYKLVDWDLAPLDPISVLSGRGIDTFWVYTNRCDINGKPSAAPDEIKQLYFIEKGVFYRQSFEYYGGKMDNKVNILPAKAIKSSTLSAEIKGRVSEMMTAKIPYRGINEPKLPHHNGITEGICAYYFEFYINGKKQETSFYREQVFADKNKENVRKNENSILIKLVKWDRLNAKND
jgi:hypothetical protein